MAGVILLGTGVVYALIGIKTKWLYTFVSTAFLTGLAATALIIYVMILPVSSPIQGAYVVAVVCTGAIFGGLAILFGEITECLGCLLGGFCLSMWLLALRPGGLVNGNVAKVAFIATFTFAGLCLYFTKWTRSYGLIACISFSGATASVLGIDCFSRAGLKEFWAYLWAVNDDLFPFGVATYPMTRGIRVELAAVFLIFLAGIASQLKLWRIIKKRRSGRDAEITEGERQLRVEEENVGRRVEEMTNRERRQWELAYGDGSASHLGDSDDSEVGDMGSEKKRRRGSTPASAILTTRAQSPTGTGKLNGRPESPVERAVTPLSLDRALATAEVAVARSQSNGNAVSRAADHDNPGTETRVKEAALGVDGESATDDAQGASSVFPASRRGSQHSSQRLVFVPVPVLIPKTQDDDERSSVATIADEDEAEQDRGQRRSDVRNRRADNLARPPSTESATILKNLSQRSTQSRVENEGTTGEQAPKPSKGETDSIIANLDDMSSVWDKDSVDQGEGRTANEPELEPDGGEEAVNQTQPAEAASGPASDSSNSGSSEKKASSPMVPGVTESTGSGVELLVDTADAVTDDRPEPASRRKSTSSLTRDNLPLALPWVARSFRTNEWAKGLCAAEIPDLASPIREQVDEEGSSISEEPAPVNVIELQQTAESASLPPAAPRLASAMSNHALHADLRSRSRGPPSGHLDAPLLELQSGNQPPLHRTTTSIPSPRNSAFFAQPITKEGNPTTPHSGEASVLGVRSGSCSPIPRGFSPLASPPNFQEPGQAVPGSYPPPRTLIDMREALLRSKASQRHLISQHMCAMPMTSSGYSSEARGILHSQNSAIDLDDDMPLRQRRDIIRQNSLDPHQFAHNVSRSASRSSLRNSSAPSPTAVGSYFDSHQPLRQSQAASEAVRQAQLASFRVSAANWRPAGAGLAGQVVNVNGGNQATGRVSSGNLRGPYLYGPEHESQRQREIDQRMRSDTLIKAHGDILRKMQRGANIG